MIDPAYIGFMAQGIYCWAAERYGPWCVDPNVKPMNAHLAGFVVFFLPPYPISFAARTCQSLLAKQLSHPLSLSKYFSGNSWDLRQPYGTYIITFIIISGSPAFNLIDQQHQIFFFLKFHPSSILSLHLFIVYICKLNHDILGCR